MDNICIECRNSADCKHKPTANQWIVAGCPWFKTEPVITNADRIRSMTDEELAKHVCCPHDQCIDLDAKCGKCVLSWLKSPVEEDNG